LESVSKLRLSHPAHLAGNYVLDPPYSLSDLFGAFSLPDDAVYNASSQLKAFFLRQLHYRFGNLLRAHEQTISEKFKWGKWIPSTARDFRLWTSDFGP
jgi:hypothetical protein